MSDIFRLDRAAGVLLDAAGRRFDVLKRQWQHAGPPLDDAALETVDALDAVSWLQRASGEPVRVPIGVIGPRDAGETQLAAALVVGELLARCGLLVVCGGRQGVMQAVAEGVARNGGVCIGVLGDADPSYGNRHLTAVLATGIGEARNALIARAALCLVAIGDSYGTLSEVALGRQFGKLVLGLEGAAQVDGVVHVATPEAAIERVARHVLRMD
jgi:uncharacterized protein (TIGR00725 family)